MPKKISKYFKKLFFYLYNFFKDRLNPAFSLIELLISLIAVSTLISAFAPMITKKMPAAIISPKVNTSSSSGISVSSSSVDIYTTCTDSKYVPTNSHTKCQLCNKDECLVSICLPGYIGEFKKQLQHLILYISHWV